MQGLLRKPCVQRATRVFCQLGPGSSAACDSSPSSSSTTHALAIEPTSPSYALDGQQQRAALSSADYEWERASATRVITPSLQGTVPFCQQLYSSMGYKGTTAARMVVATSVAGLAAVASFTEPLTGLLGLGAIEAVFAGFMQLCFVNFNQAPAQQLVPSAESAQETFKRFIKASSSHWCTQAFLRTWFWDVDPSELSRSNVAELIAYGFFNRTVQQMDADGLSTMLSRMVDQIEESAGLTFTDAPYKKLPFMSHVWDDVQASYFPALYYGSVEVLMMTKHVSLLASGFKHTEHAGFDVYTYGDLSQPGVQPYVFLHGIALGMQPYVGMVQRLAATGRPVIILEARHLALRVCSAVPTVDVMADTLVDVLKQHKVSSVHLVAHSFGTFTASRVAKRYKHVIASLTLLDPVCFLMFTGHLIRNFVYRRDPEHAPFSSVDAFCMHMVCRHLWHSVAVSRDFYWAENSLWPDQLPEHTLVVLAGQDTLLPGKGILSMLQQETNAHIIYHPDYAHGAFVWNQDWQHEVVHAVARLASEATAQPGLGESAVLAGAGIKAGKGVALAAVAVAESK